MSAAEQMRTAATKLRADRPYGDLDEPLAAWLEGAAERCDHLGVDVLAYDVTRVINGGA